MYTKHEMEVIHYEDNNTFVRADMSGFDHGESVWSIKPDRSDSQGIFAMYEKHQLDTVSFDKTDVFADEHSSGDGEGYFRNKPEVSDI